MKHIELFAGCGGLCLGLNKAGFTLDGLDSFGDVKGKVLSGEKASGTINLGMEKESVKEYCKSDR